MSWVLKSFAGLSLALCFGLCLEVLIESILVQADLDF